MNEIPDYAPIDAISGILDLLSFCREHKPCYINILRYIIRPGRRGRYADPPDDRRSQRLLGNARRLTAPVVSTNHL